RAMNALAGLGRQGRIDVASIGVRLQLQPRKAPVLAKRAARPDTAPATVPAASPKPLHQPLVAAGDDADWETF
ncbi:methyl-accepting chemotaxis protein, partial [Ralstonia pseudosolanacearum]